MSSASEPNFPSRVSVTLRLYDVFGRDVRTVYGRDDKGRRVDTVDLSSLASGTYFLRLLAGGQIRIQKLTVAR